MRSSAPRRARRRSARRGGRTAAHPACSGRVGSIPCVPDRLGPAPASPPGHRSCRAVDSSATAGRPTSSSNDMTTISTSTSAGSDGPGYLVGAAWGTPQGRQRFGPATSITRSRRHVRLRATRRRFGLGHPLRGVRRVAHRPDRPSTAAPADPGLVLREPAGLSTRTFTCLRDRLRVSLASNGAFDERLPLILPPDGSARVGAASTAGYARSGTETTTAVRTRADHPTADWQFSCEERPGHRAHHERSALPLFRSGLRLVRALRIGADEQAHLRCPLPRLTAAPATPVTSSGSTGGYSSRLLSAGLQALILVLLARWAGPAAFGIVASAHRHPAVPRPASPTSGLSGLLLRGAVGTRPSALHHRHPAAQPRRPARCSPSGCLIGLRRVPLATGRRPCSPCSSPADLDRRGERTATPGSVSPPPPGAGFHLVTSSILDPPRGRPALVVGLARIVECARSAYAAAVAVRLGPGQPGRCAPAPAEPAVPDGPAAHGRAGIAVLPPLVRHNDPRRRRRHRRRATASPVAAGIYAVPSRLTTPLWMLRPRSAS